MRKQISEAMPCVLAIGGLDPSGGAGLPADARAIAAFGAHCCGVTTAVIAQNTRGVLAIEAVSPAMFTAQFDNLIEDMQPHAIKIGMLPNVEIVRCLIPRLQALRGIPIVIDTVFAPSSGPQFSDSATVNLIAKQLLPLAELVTPNLIEAAQLYGQPIADWTSAIAAAQDIRERYGPAYVLLKGGHWTATASSEAVDLLVSAHEQWELRAPRTEGYEVRGTGCLLASAIAAQRAQGVPVLEAAQAAKGWLTEQIQDAKAIGQGRRVATALTPNPPGA